MIELNIDSFLRGKAVRNLSGHERGIAARNFYGLDELDSIDDEVVFTISDDIDGIANSFFQGMFAKSIRELSNDHDFLDHYKFRANSSVVRQIETGIRRINTIRGSAFAH